MNAPDLPQELSPWAPALKLFSPEMALGLGPMLRKVARAIGPIDTPSRSMFGEPDGYDGLMRKGPLERLLPSEWLLAFELPDEFLRRATQGEQAYFSLARREPGGNRRNVVLFDAGPSTIGAPRIGSLALLIALAARAEAAGARFAWGVLQDERRGQIAELSRASIARLITGRSALEPTEKDAAEWLAQIGPPEEADDLWIAGAERAQKVFQHLKVSRARFEEPLDRSLRRLTLTVSRPNRADRSVELDLPSENASVRLLRDPYREYVAKPLETNAAIDPAAGLCFSPNGRQLAARTTSGDLLVFPVPNSSRAPAGRATTIRPSTRDRRLAGITWLDKRIHVVELGGGGLVLRMVGPRGGTHQFWESGFDLQIPGPALSAIGCLRTGEGKQLFVHDAESRTLWMFALRGTPQQLFYEGRAQNVTGLISMPGQVGYLQAPNFRDRSIGQLWVATEHHAPIASAELTGSGDFSLVSGSPGYGISTHFGLIAVRAEDHTWAVPLVREVRWIETERHANVIGVRASPDGKSPGLVLLKDDHLSFACRNEGVDLPLFKAPKRVTAAAMSTSYFLIAYLLEDGELIVRHFSEGVVLRIRPGEEQP